ncbi:MAG: large-conductance mechanosensitive channel protein MscL [Dehalococcoidia bacterium]|nr:large-conductance mechanosensitive channel protein MscL [Dehalococcoidia bacterium]MDD5494531.1 large-conductance mechanosensitive channel protein MscL [Dehalococcoidia bacterium]
MLTEFKQFIMRGNVLDMAIGIVIGVAFGKIVTSLVNDIIMPPVGLLLGKVSFQDLYINLSGQSYASLDVAKVAGAPTINYGAFLNTVFDFIIVAFVIFFLIKMFNKVRRQGEKPAEVTTRECPYCISTIAIKATRCPNCTSDLP